MHIFFLFHRKRNVSVLLFVPTLRLKSQLFVDLMLFSSSNENIVLNLILRTFVGKKRKIHDLAQNSCRLSFLIFGHFFISIIKEKVEDLSFIWLSHNPSGNKNSRMLNFSQLHIIKKLY